jgi:hypothetical protein
MSLASPDCAGCCGHEDVSALERGTRLLRALQGHERREDGHAECSGRRVIALVADRGDRRLRRAIGCVGLLRRDRILRDRSVPAIAGVDEFHSHARPGRQPLALLDHADPLEANHVRRARRAVEEVAIPDVQLDGVERRCPDAHQRLARPAQGLRYLRCRRRAAERRDERRAHR